MSHALYVVPMVLITVVVSFSQLLAGAVGTETLGLMYEWQYDKLQHFIAGTACGVFGVWCAAALRLRQQRLLLLCAAASALFIGGMWEVYEHWYPEVNGGTHSYFSLDTQLDLLFDVLGGLCAAWCYRERSVT